MIDLVERALSLGTTDSIALVLAALARPVGIAIALPLRGGAATALPRFALVVALGLLFLPTTFPLALEAEGPVAVTLAYECGAGIACGIALAMTLDVASALGGLFDAGLRGRTAMSVRAPGPAAVLAGVVGIAVFLSAGGFALLVEALASSYIRVPLGGATGPMLSSALIGAGSFFGVALALGLPILIVTSFAEVGAGLVQRIMGTSAEELTSAARTLAMLTTVGIALEFAAVAFARWSLESLASLPG